MSARIVNHCEQTTELFEPHEFNRLTQELQLLSMLTDLVQWGVYQKPPVRTVEVLTQDEFTHDVIFHWRDSLYLVADTT